MPAFDGTIIPATGSATIYFRDAYGVVVPQPVQAWLHTAEGTEPLITDGYRLYRVRDYEEAKRAELYDWCPWSCSAHDVAPVDVHCYPRHPADPVEYHRNIDSRVANGADPRTARREARRDLAMGGYSIKDLVD